MGNLGLNSIVARSKDCLEEEEVEVGCAATMRGTGSDVEVHCTSGDYQGRRFVAAAAVEEDTACWVVYTAGSAVVAMVAWVGEGRMGQGLFAADKMKAVVAGGHQRMRC